MSTNCVKCIKKPRLIGLLCKECHDQDWNEKMDKMLVQYPPLNDFIVSWQKHVGKDDCIFASQLCRMLLDCWQIAGQKIIEEAKGAKIEDATGIELLYAMSPRLEEDVLLALRFLYYVKAHSAIPDDRYDQAEKKFLAREDIEESLLMNPGSDCADDYPERARALGFYILLITEARRKAMA